MGSSAYGKGNEQASSGGLAPLVSSKEQVSNYFQYHRLYSVELGSSSLLSLFHCLRFEPQGHAPNFFLLVVPPEYLCES